MIANYSKIQKNRERSLSLPANLSLHTLLINISIGTIMIRLFLNICKTFREIKHLNINDYELFLLLSANSDLDSFSCPSCHAPVERFVRNGCYQRHLVFIHQNTIHDKLIVIQDFKCTSCSKTHALLYSLIIPHSSYSIQFMVSLIYDRITRRFQNIQKLCPFYDISDRTFYRIWNRLFLDSHHMSAILNAFHDLLQIIHTLFRADTFSLHMILESFFYSCGYSFLQPCITFRQKILNHGSPPYLIR